MVTIGRQLNDRSGLPYVDLHSAYTARLLLDHLRDQGSRNIALVMGAQPRNSYRETEKEYASFAKRHRMPSRILRLDESSGEAAARIACRTLLEHETAIDALCVPVDAFATGAVQAAADLGRRIPNDLKLGHPLRWTAGTGKPPANHRRQSVSAGNRGHRRPSAARSVDRRRRHQRACGPVAGTDREGVVRIAGADAELMSAVLTDASFTSDRGNSSSAMRPATLHRPAGRRR